jgi:hypothetical protein
VGPAGLGLPTIPTFHTQVQNSNNPNHLEKRFKTFTTLTNSLPIKISKKNKILPVNIIIIF